MPKTFRERYEAGDREAVWEDLAALGSGATHELYLADAQAVARETMRRARRNVETLIGRLEQLGYRFFDSYSSAQKRLEEIEKLDGMLRGTSMPKLNFGGGMMDALKQMGPGMTATGIDPQAMMARAVEQARERMASLRPGMSARVEVAKQRAQQHAAEVSKKPPLQDPAVFSPPGKDTRKLLDKVERLAGGPMPLSLRAWYEEVGSVSFLGSHPLLNSEGHRVAPDPLFMSPLEYAVESLDEREEDDTGLLVELSPDDLHKANISGGDPCMRVPDAVADGKLLYESHDTTLVGYLRRSFAWGGFPGWERESDAPVKELDFLREGLLPI